MKKRAKQNLADLPGFSTKLSVQAFCLWHEAGFFQGEFERNGINIPVAD
jgi:hypothetical protein